MIFSFPSIARSHTRIAAIALLLAVGCTGDEEQSTPFEPPSMATTSTMASAYDIVRVDSITVDGSLSEWNDIAGISMADEASNGRGEANNSATVKLAWNADYLYAAYTVTDTDLRALQTERDTDIYRDDEVELFVDPQGDGAGVTSMTPTDYQFLANVRDALGDANGDGSGGKSKTYNATSFLARAVNDGTLNASGGDTGYVIELRIGWGDLGVTPAAGHSMRLDLAVGDRDGEAPSKVEGFDWAGLGNNYNNPSLWKEVQLVNPAPPSLYDVVKVSSVDVDGDLSEWAGVAAISMADSSGRTGGVDNTAKVRFAWNDTYLYGAYDVTDTELLAEQTARDAGDIYRDDEVEFYIDPQGDGAGASSMTATDYQFLANIRNALGDANGNGAGGKDKAYNAASFLARAVMRGTLNAGGADVGYAIEFQISWADLGVSPSAGQTMRIDPAVGDRDAGTPPVQSFDWAGLGTNYNNPSAWSVVKLVTDASPPTAPTNPVANAVSASQIDLSWTGSTSPDASKYNIYRGTTGTPTLLTSVSNSPYQDKDLNPGTEYTYQVSAVDAAGNESPRTAPVSATTGSSGSTGRPFGTFAMLVASNPVGTSSFTVSQEYVSWANEGGTRPLIIQRIEAARAKGTKLVTAMTGGSHSRYITNGKFDMDKWKHGNTAVHGSGMDGYKLKANGGQLTQEHHDIINQAIADGVLLGNSIMDEPEHSSWGRTANNESFMTKEMLDEMAGYVKAIFPTLPVGADFGPGGGKHWRPTEQYEVLDWVNHQYNWWVFKGDVARFRDSMLVYDARDGVRTLLGLNLLDGGVQAERDGNWNCPSGRGTFEPNCRVTPAQLREWGIILGKGGNGLKLWRYDATTMGDPAYQDAFADVADELADLPTPRWTRP